MSSKLTKLPTTQFSGLDYDNVLNDIYNLVQNNPDYNENWDDFISSSAGRMLIELYAYIADQLATRIDWVANEGYITTATQNKSILRLLKLIGYKISLATCASVEATLLTNKAISEEIVLTPIYEELSATRNNIFSIQANDKTGTIKNFEAIKYNATDQKFDYKAKVSINANNAGTKTSSFSLPLYEGTTKVETFTSITDENPVFTLTYGPVINNSIVVYLVTTDDNGVQIEKELIGVNNFLDVKAQKATYPIPYVINTYDTGYADIEFAPSSIINNTSKRFPAGSTIVVFYRIGGGSKGNILKQSLNTVKTLSTVNGDPIDIQFINYNEGSGGTDNETAEHAALYGPLTIKTVGKTVTAEDYDIVLSGNATVLKSKSYGSNNMPSNFYEKYGVYINPQEVWSFVLLNKSWENVPASEYNNFKWIDLRLENRFNELYSFNSGKFNNVSYLPSEAIKEETMIANSSPQTFKNFFPFYVSDAFKNSIYTFDSTGAEILNTNFVCKNTTSSTESLFFNAITNHFVNGNHASDGLGQVGSSYNYTNTMDCHAEFICPIGVKNTSTDINNEYGFDVTIKKSIGLNIDGRGMIVIPLTYDYASDANKRVYLSNPNPLVPPNSNSAYEARYHYGIVEKINSALTGASDTYNLYGSSAKSMQYLGLNVVSENAEAPGFVGVSSATIFKLVINGTTYDIPYGDETHLSKYYKDIVTYINEVLIAQNSVYRAKFALRQDTTYDICFQTSDSSTVNIERYSSINTDILTKIYNNNTQVPSEAIPGGNYSTVASVITDASGAKYLKFTSPTIGHSSSVQFIVSDFSNNVSNSTEFMDTVGVKFYGNISAISVGQKIVTLVTNKNCKYFGYFIYEHNSASYSSLYSRTVYTHYLKEKKDSIDIGSVYDNFYLTGTDDDNLYKNKAKYVYSTGFNEYDEVDINSTKAELRFTKNKIDSNSIWNIETEIDIYPRDIIKLKTIDLSVITSGYFTSTDIFGISFDNGPTITLTNMQNYTKPADFINAFIVAMQNSTYLDANKYYEVDYDYENVFYFKNVSKKPDAKIVFKRTYGAGITNSAYSKIFGNNLNEIYGLESTELVTPTVVEVTVQDEVIFDYRFIDPNTNLIRLPDYYLSFDTTNQNFKMIKEENSKLPDSEFYLHFINDRRNEKDDDGNLITLDEDNIISYLKDYRITGIENKIVKARFGTFDIAATIMCEPLFNPDTIKNNLETFLKDNYRIDNRGFGQSVILSQLMTEMHSITGVKYVQLSYLGRDYTNSSTNVTEISCEFDEVLVLSETRNSAEGIQNHGLIFTYKTYTGEY